MSLDPVPTAQAKVLLALARMDRPTVRALMAATGIRSTRTVLDALHDLRATGMVTWEDGQRGTMRPTFECRWPS